MPLSASPSPSLFPRQVKVTEFSQLRSTLQAAARKQQGSLAVRDLSGLVPPGQLVHTENLTTLLVVVPKSARADWMGQYEQLSEFVVPRSSDVRGGGGGGVWMCVCVWEGGGGGGTGVWRRGGVGPLLGHAPSGFDAQTVGRCVLPGTSTVRGCNLSTCPCPRTPTESQTQAEHQG